MQTSKPILLIEDGEVSAAIIKRTLEELNVMNELMCAATGEEGLACLVSRNRERPCVILVDLNTSRTDHVEFLSTVRMQEELSRIPIVAIVSSARECDTDETSNLGIAACIVKCPDYEQFRERLRSIKSYCQTDHSAEQKDVAYDVTRRVLLVEDNRVDQIVFRRQVRSARLPYDCTIANSVSEARKILQSRQFDIVISDYSLGDGTAFDVLPLVKDAPVVLVTGAGDEEIAVKAWKAGAYDYLVKDSHGDYLKTLAITVENAIEHRRAKKEVELLSGAIMSADDCIYIADMHGKIIFVNNAFCRLYGYTKTQILEKDASVLWTGEHQRRHMGCVMEIPTAGGGRAIGFYHERRDGTMFPVSLCRSIIRDRNNKSMAVVGIARDMSERLLLVDEFRDEITSLTAHCGQYNTLITTAMATLSSLLTSRNIERALHLVAGLRDILGLEAKEVQLNHMNVDLGPLVAHIVETLKPFAAERGVQLKNLMPSDELVVDLDRNHAVHVLTSILRSLAEIVPPGNFISVSAEDMGDGTTIAVNSDDSAAIDMAHKAMEGSHTFPEHLDPYGDIALHLFVAKKLMELHGVSVSVNGGDQQGSSLLITWPDSVVTKTDSMPVSLSRIG